MGLAIPLSGPLGLLGPSSLNSALLACEELNAADGVASRPLELVVVDAGQEPPRVARQLAELAADRSLDALVGMHTSTVRRAIVRQLGGRVPYVYTPPYEGGERARGVFLLGSTPAEQLSPALRWLAARAARRWVLVGNDYVWPRRVNSLAREELAVLGATVAGELYLPFGATDLDATIRALRDARPHALLITLIGEELVRFERRVADEARLARLPQLCLALDENVLLAFAEVAPANLFSAMEYFAEPPTPDGRLMAERYRIRFGPDAPLLSVYAQSCYEGVHALAALARRAGSLHVGAIEARADGTVVEAGRGSARLRGRALRPDVYLAQADGSALRVLVRLPRAGR
ncbi:MAG TPA: substrate-binding domain-containing protein [Solirubrobacteraceae bacterium]|nr:substrate-binding domain-containing protein [Solirubrobacteraceae bacterium]